MSSDVDSAGVYFLSVEEFEGKTKPKRADAKRRDEEGQAPEPAADSHGDAAPPQGETSR